ncbi:MAG: ornithine cyclodeaminase family protein [Candidatus Aminicenantes bacterium]|nr:ornithine cyclodeaminase family protein [Candidatus Aminicenantes bacterium]
MLFLNSDEIARLADRSELITLVEAAFRIQASGNFQMPVRTQVEYKGKILLSMPCFTDSCFGAKLVSIVPENLQKKLPPLFGIVVLNDGETGEPLAILNGAKITALRTAAVGALSIKYLAAAAVSRLGVIGAGVQGYNQTMFACSVRQFTDVYLYDHNEKALHVLGEKLAAELRGVTIICEESALAVLRQSEVVITATNTEQPLFPNDRALFQNRHFVGIGSYKPEMREYPEALFRNLKYLLLDTEHALQETGDVVTPLEKGWIAEKQIMPFNLVMSGKIVDVVNEYNVTFFKSVGMALFDIVIADFICDKARKESCGFEINL